MLNNNKPVSVNENSNGDKNIIFMLKADFLRVKKGVYRVMLEQNNAF